MQIVLDAAGARHPAAVAGRAPALHEVHLRVQAGEHLAVIGPSGAGKTSLVHLLACALAPASGRFALDGQDPWQLAAAPLRNLRGQLFLAPQVPPLPARQRVVTAVLAGRLPHVGLWTSLRSLVRPNAQEIDLAEQALAAFGLADKLWDRVDRLSGGERQRVGLARALTARARLLLVDEPLSALDPARASQALGVLCEAARERGATLVATLHDVPLALRHFPRVVGMRAGRVVFDQPSAQVTPAQLDVLYADDPGTAQAVARAGELPLPPRPALVCR